MNNFISYVDTKIKNNFKLLKNIQESFEWPHTYPHSLHFRPNTITLPQYPQAIETSSCFPENRCLIECPIQNFIWTVGVRGDCDIDAE